MFADDEKSELEGETPSGEAPPGPPEVDENAETVVMSSRREPVEQLAGEEAGVEAPAHEEEPAASEAESQTIEQPKTPPEPPAPETIPSARADDSWITAGSARPAAVPSPHPEPAPAAAQKEEEAFTPSPVSTPPEPVAARPAAPKGEPTGNAFGPVGDLLAQIGITNRQTQQWVAIGAAVAILACCACACLVILIPTLTGSNIF